MQMYGIAKYKSHCVVISFKRHSKGGISDTGRGERCDYIL